MIADPLAALIGWLRARPALSAAPLSGRIFAGALPPAEVPNMPRMAVVVRAAGGPESPRHLPIVVMRLDVMAYGRTHHEAAAAQWPVFDELRRLVRVTTGGTLLHAANPAGGPISGRDPDTEWPQLVTSWLLTAAEEAP